MNVDSPLSRLSYANIIKNSAKFLHNYFLYFYIFEGDADEANILSMYKWLRIF